VNSDRKCSRRAGCCLRRGRPARGAHRAARRRWARQVRGQWLEKVGGWLEEALLEYSRGIQVA
jgi:hypothetical protein